MPNLISFDDILEFTLTEAAKTPEYTAAVAVVQSGNKWLLGLSTATDDRRGKWCFPGGGIKRNEAASKAATRECHEETGIRCRAVGKPFNLPDKKHVAFVHCKATMSQKIDNNNEFLAIGWFSLSDMRHIKLYKNVKQLIKQIT